MGIIFKFAFILMNVVGSTLLLFVAIETLQQWEAESGTWWPLPLVLFMCLVYADGWANLLFRLYKDAVEEYKTNTEKYVSLDHKRGATRGEK